MTTAREPSINVTSFPVLLKKTVSIGLKNKLRVEHPIYVIWGMTLVKGSIQFKVLFLIQLIMENRLRHARGPVHIYVTEGRLRDGRS